MACAACEERRKAMQKFWQSFVEWTKQPYSPDMTVFDWFLFIGLIIVLFWIWGTLIRKVVD